MKKASNRIANLAASVVIAAMLISGAATTTA